MVVVQPVGKKQKQKQKTETELKRQKGKKKRMKQSLPYFAPFCNIRFVYFLSFNGASSATVLLFLHLLYMFVTD